jgi:hypothetical protein
LRLEIQTPASWHIPKPELAQLGKTWLEICLRNIVSQRISQIFQAHPLNMKHKSAGI